MKTIDITAADVHSPAVPSTTLKMFRCSKMRRDIPLVAAAQLRQRKV